MPAAAAAAAAGETEERAERGAAAHARHCAWLQLTEEAPIDPGRQIIDAHHHLWDKHPTRDFARRYMLDEIADDIARSGHAVTHTVYMQSSSAGWLRAGGDAALRVAGESEVAQGAAAMAESGRYGTARVCAGVVATADMLLGDGVRAVVAEHRRVARNFRGVRYLGGKAEEIPFTDPRFLAAARAFAELGVVYDVNGPETHPLDFGVLTRIAGLAAAIPGLTIVVDHCGGAVGPTAFGRDAAGHGARGEWEEAMRALAALPNVRAKLGGLHMPQNGICERDRDRPIGSAELAERTLPYYAFVIRAFGAERCMFESNFPVDRWGVGYGVLWNSFKRAAAALRLSDAELDAVFRGTAERTYRLRTDATGAAPPQPPSAAAAPPQRAAGGGAAGRDCGETSDLASLLPRDLHEFVDPSTLAISM